MAHTYAANFIHCIFNTKQRRSSIPADRLPQLLGYFSGIAKSEGFSLLLAGGTTNHVHLLIALPPVRSLADAI